LKITAHQGKIE